MILPCASAVFQKKASSAVGVRAESKVRPPPRPEPSNTPVRLITLRDSPISIPMAPFPTAVPMDLVGDHLASVSGGLLSPMGSGSWIPLLATPGSAISRGAGLLITTGDGSSIPPAAAGFIPLPFFTDTQDMEVFREGTSLVALIHLASSIIR